MGAELQGLQAGEERRGSDASRTGDCCMETVWVQIFNLGMDLNGGFSTWEWI